MRRYFIPGTALGLAASGAVFLGAPRWLRLTLIALTLMLLFLGGNKYRCPVCRRIPVDEGGGFDLDPRECGRCGTMLSSGGEV
jgi:hypothetical protein